MEKAKHFYYYSCTTIAYGDGNHGTAIEHRQAAADPRIEENRFRIVNLCQHRPLSSATYGCGAHLHFNGLDSAVDLHQVS